MAFYDELTAAVGTAAVWCDEPMSAHTTFRIGGKADYFVTPENEEALQEGISVCIKNSIPYFITGNGSNLLVGDGGFRGVIFNICKTMDQIDYETSADQLIVTAGAGVLLIKLAREVSEKGYTGFEYATGIPGTLGGAVAMNAGAYGGEINDAILWADIMDRSGRVRRVEKIGLRMGYRHSIVTENDCIVLRAAFAFAAGDTAKISERVAALAVTRREKQPLEYPSAGSTFKRPEGYFAGKLIEDCGLKGCRVGDAMVSEKHSGFVINTGHATAKDVLMLIQYVQRTVDEKFHVKIEPEVRMIGEFLQ